MQEFKKMWEDWYADLLDTHEWCELQYKGREIIYVHGNTRYTGAEGSFGAAFIQVMAHLEPELTMGEEEQKEIIDLLKSRHGLDNIRFWSV